MPAPERAANTRAVLITGGGSGLGAAIARRFLALGDTVMIVQRTQEEAVAGLQAIGGAARLTAVVADLSSIEGCIDAVRRCREGLGGIDILVNNAAVTGPAAIGPFMEFSTARMDEILNVNLRAPFVCAQEAARSMVSSGKGGVIINIGSTASLVAQPDAAAYVAAKTGLLGLTRALALDLADFSIRCVMIAPGAISTDASSDAEYRSNRISHPRRHAPLLDGRAHADDVAAAVTYACSQEARFVTGSIITIDGGLTSY